VGIDCEKSIRTGAGWASKNRICLALNVPALFGGLRAPGFSPAFFFLCEVGVRVPLLKFRRASFFFFIFLWRAE